MMDKLSAFLKKDWGKSEHAHLIPEQFCFKETVTPSLFSQSTPIFLKIVLIIVHFIWNELYIHPGSFIPKDSELFYSPPPALNFIWTKPKIFLHLFFSLPPCFMLSGFPDPVSSLALKLLSAVLGLGCRVGFFWLQRARASLWVQCMGFSLQSRGSRHVDSGCGSQAWEHRLVVVALKLCCSAAGGLFPGQGSNPWILHWQADSLPLSHQGSPSHFSLFAIGRICKASPRSN